MIAGVWVYLLKPPRDQRLADLLAVRTGSARIASTFIEQRVFEPNFYLGYDKAGALSEFANVDVFMRQTAKDIVEEAIEIADPTPKPPTPRPPPDFGGSVREQDDDEDEEEEDDDDDDDDDED